MVNLISNGFAVVAFVEMLPQGAKINVSVQQGAVEDKHRIGCLHRKPACLQRKLACLVLFRMPFAIKTSLVNAAANAQRNNLKTKYDQPLLLFLLWRTKQMEKLLYGFTAPASSWPR